MENVHRAVPFHLDDKKVIKTTDGYYRNRDSSHNFKCESYRYRWTLLSSRVYGGNGNPWSVYLGIDGLDKTSSLGTYQEKGSPEIQRGGTYSFVLPCDKIYYNGKQQYVYGGYPNQIKFWFIDDKGQLLTPSHFEIDFLIECIENGISNIKSH